MGFVAKRRSCGEAKKQGLGGEANRRIQYEFNLGLYEKQFSVVSGCLW
jgi:hypothetical protein